MVKKQWRGRLNAWGQASFSAPAAKHVSYVREGGRGGWRASVQHPPRSGRFVITSPTPRTHFVFYKLTNAFILNQWSESVCIWFLAFCSPQFFHSCRSVTLSVSIEADVFLQICLYFCFSVSFSLYLNPHTLVHLLLTGSQCVKATMINILKGDFNNCNFFCIM